MANISDAYSLSWAPVEFGDGSGRGSFEDWLVCGGWPDASSESPKVVAEGRRSWYLDGCEAVELPEPDRGDLAWPELWAKAGAAELMGLLRSQRREPLARAPREALDSDATPGPSERGMPMRNARLTLPFALAAALTCCGYPDEFAVADSARASAEGGPEAGTPDVAAPDADAAPADVSAPDAAPEPAPDAGPDVTHDAADDRADVGPEAHADLADAAAPDAAPEPGPEAGTAAPDAGPDVTHNARDTGFEAGPDVTPDPAEAGRDGSGATDAAEAAVERCSASACGACVVEAGCGWCGYYERCQRSGVGVCPGGWRAVGVAACEE